MDASAECEGVAAELLSEARLAFPVNPWTMTARLGVKVAYGRAGRKPYAKWNGFAWTVYLDPLDRPERQALALLHELAHIFLDANMLPNDEYHAWRLAGALLLPRHDFITMRRRRITLDQIVAMHPWASHEAVARREVGLTQTSVLWIEDRGPDPRTYRVLSPGWRWRLREPTAIEREAMTAALASRTVVEPMGGVRAWCVEDPPWTRVLCLSDGEVLLPQLN